MIQLGRRTYWVSVVVSLCLFGAIWASVFSYVYGWQMDDRMIFIKGSDTVANWRGAFSYYNALQPYFFLVSYLPLKWNLSLPSFPLPDLGSQAGHFRFLLAYMVFLHLFVAASWAWFLGKISSSRLTNLLAFGLWITSPTFLLWTPQPDSRIIGLPLVLAGTVPLLRLDSLLDARGGRVLLYLMFSGFVFGLAQSLHYTSLYLLAPICAVYWMSAALKSRRWSTLRFWQSASIFGMGLVLVPLLMEGLSYAAGLAFDNGPLMTLLKLRSMHRSGELLFFDVRLWASFFASQMGYPMVCCIILGAVIYCKNRGWTARVNINANRLVAAICLSMVYLLVSGNRPFFRQTSVIQPFLFFFAAVAIVYFVSRIKGAYFLRLGALLVLSCVVGFTQWKEAHAVFVGHQGVGRALEWASSHKQEGGLQTLQIAWFSDVTSLSTREALAQANPEDWLITYFPWQLLEGRSPSLIPAFEDVKPLFSAPTLYSTAALGAEIKATWPDFDLTRQAELSEARVYKIGDLIRYLQPAQRITVRSVTADSVASANWEAGNVFDQDSAADGFTTWVSNDAPGSHYLEIEFGQPMTISTMRIIMPPTDRSAGRIVSAEIQDPTGHKTLWRGDDLDGYQVLEPMWQATELTGVRLIVKRFAQNGTTLNAARIEEVTFPGFVIEPLPLKRVIPQLIATGVAVSGSRITVVGQNMTPYVAIVVDGVPISTTFVNANQVSGILPKDLAGSETPQVKLADHLRTTASLTLAPGSLIKSGS